MIKTGSVNFRIEKQFELKMAVVRVHGLQLTAAMKWQKDSYMSASPPQEKHLGIPEDFVGASCR